MYDQWLSDFMRGINRRNYDLHSVKNNPEETLERITKLQEKIEKLEEIVQQFEDQKENFEKTRSEE